MSHDGISPLRQRMIWDMTIRQFGDHTQRDYIRQVREFTAFLGRSPDRAEPEDLRRYQLHLASLGASYARMNLAGTALRFFFHTTLGRAGFGDRMARIPSPERLPVVLSPEEIALLLAHAPGLVPERDGGDRRRQGEDVILPRFRGHGVSSLSARPARA